MIFLDPLVIFFLLSAHCNRVFRGFPGGWMDVRVDVLRGVSMYVSLGRCVPDLRLEVCGAEPPRVFVWTIGRIVNVCF